MADATARSQRALESRRNGRHPADRRPGDQLPSADGTTITDARKDSLVGGRLVDDGLRTNGKFVDLDPTDQSVTELYAMRPTLRDSTGQQVLRADVLTTAVEDIWLRALAPVAHPYPSAVYQSVLTGLEWAGSSTPRC